ncbi:hypothetical protein D3C72_1934140 [compost metagenome]
MLVPLASVLSARGGWEAVFTVAAVVTIAAGISAKVLLAPVRRRFITGQAEGLQVADAAYLPRIQREGD